MDEGYRMIFDHEDEARKKRNRSSKRKSRQRQAEQAKTQANQEQEDPEQRPTSCSRELESGFSSRETVPVAQNYQEGIWSPALVSNRGSADQLDAPIREEYELDLQELMASNSLDHFVLIGEKPATQRWSGTGNDSQLSESTNTVSSAVAEHDLVPVPQLWTKYPSEFPVELPQKHLQHRQGHRDKRAPALHRAVITGKEDIVRLLLQNQAVVDACDKDGCTALDLAIDAGHTSIVQILLAYGADTTGN